MPELSVILPNYNHSKYLTKRIESILNQTFQDFELIILDDKSTDDSLTIIEKYRNHPKVSKIIVNEQNSGSTFKQWEKGIREAMGEFIWIAESDDFADERLAEVLLEPLKKNKKIGISYCQSWAVDANDNITYSLREHYSDRWNHNYENTGTDEAKKYFITYNPVSNASSAIFRKEFALNENEYTQMRYSGDWLFWVMILLQADIHYHATELNYFRQHVQNVSGGAERNGLYFIEGLKVMHYIRRKIGFTSYENNKVASLWANVVIEEIFHRKRKVLYSRYPAILRSAFSFDPFFAARVGGVLLNKVVSRFKLRPGFAS